MLYPHRVIHRRRSANRVCAKERDRIGKKPTVDYAPIQLGEVVEADVEHPITIVDAFILHEVRLVHSHEGVDGVLKKAFQSTIASNDGEDERA